MRLTRMLAVAMGAALVFAAAACSNEDGKGGTDSPKTVEKLSYSTSFGTFGRESYVYVAQEKGYFAEAGIEVIVKPGNGTGEVLKNMVAGQIDIAPVDSTGYLLQVGTG